MNISLFGNELPLYGLLFYLGILLASLAGIGVCKAKKLPISELVYSAVYTMIGAFLGAKLLFIFTALPQIIAYQIPFINIIKGGFVFYGGLFGGLLGLFIYTRQFKLPLLPYTDVYTVILPLGHAVGRIGCFFAGCCYGIPFAHGHIYTETVGTTPLGIPLLPIQLIESGLLLLLFAVQLILLLRKTEKNGLLTHVYLFSYPILRFILEFFRGDAERGVLLLSTSQWISLLLLAVAILWLVSNDKKAKTQKSTR